MRTGLRIGALVGVAGFLAGVLLFAVLTGFSTRGSGGASAPGGQQVQASCGHILNRLPAAVRGGTPVTSASSTIIQP